MEKTQVKVKKTGQLIDVLPQEAESGIHEGRFDKPGTKKEAKPEPESKTKEEKATGKTKTKATE